jgi:hypothetical protein
MPVLGTDGFVARSGAHERKIGYVVLPPMLVATAAVLCIVRPFQVAVILGWTRLASRWSEHRRLICRSLAMPSSRFAGVTHH